MTLKWHQQNKRVQYKDTDQMGVVHHGNYITWFEVGRTEWMRHYGIAYHGLEAAGLFLPVRDVQAHYVASAAFDDCIAIFTTVRDFTPVRLEFAYEVRKLAEENCVVGYSAKVEEPGGALLATGTTTHIFVNSAWKATRFDKAAPETYRALKDLLAAA